MSEQGTTKKYLKLYNQVGYGIGAMGTNILYALPSYFIMIYLTDSVGLKPGIIGTLMVVSKLFDGVTDVICGNLIDKTHTKMGKARPWLLFSMFGAAICRAACADGAVCLVLLLLYVPERDFLYGQRNRVQFPDGVGHEE